ncbi:TIGR01459 family HAD-type hydrolase (plasmid) [Pseudorhodobacter turbinis]|uniref:TIGR01459 family HAD-type hydrolase n=2 Tax=Pseudorhodobacter turbinis TaxID=2500533 RepID=A0A4P8EL52_9RHOB|nr:HAD hydrolase-like protein [Pseudorhodobacter turbinis]QCO58000.1 TIGR01459 family HAD-type hydrolase [Pseudorhodobacter turbinis]
MTGRGGASQAAFADITAPFDLVLFDAYGVLNVGETAIPGAAASVRALRAAGKSVAVVSNSAAYPKSHMMARYHKLGFDFAESEVVTSRDALLQRIAAEPELRWGLMLNPNVALGELATLDAIVLTDDPAAYDEVDGFLLIGADGWTERRQTLLEAALARAPRPVFVGNPDLVAPRENGLSLEPGWFAHRLADRMDIAPTFLGKPFPEVFDLAMTRLAAPVAADRVLMVGDTLHTDILGGRQAGFATALVTAHGSLAGLNVDDAIDASGITPDFIVPHI